MYVCLCQPSCLGCACFASRKGFQPDLVSFNTAISSSPWPGGFFGLDKCLGSLIVLVLSQKAAKPDVPNPATGNSRFLSSLVCGTRLAAIDTPARIPSPVPRASRCALGSRCGHCEHFGRHLGAGLCQSAVGSECDARLLSGSFSPAACCETYGCRSTLCRSVFQESQAPCRSSMPTRFVRQSAVQNLSDCFILHLAEGNLRKRPPFTHQNYKTGLRFPITKDSVQCGHEQLRVEKSKLLADCNGQRPCGSNAQERAPDPPSFRTKHAAREFVALAAL